jgi:hypothetical protein
MTDDAASLDEIRAVLTQVGLDVDDASPEELRELFQILSEEEQDTAPPAAAPALLARLQERLLSMVRARRGRPEQRD